MNVTIGISLRNEDKNINNEKPQSFYDLVFYFIKFDNKNI